MFRYFEQLVNPFPDRAPSAAPANVYQFCRHYSRGLEHWLLLLALLSTLIAVVEVALFDVLGRAVDLLANTTPAEVGNNGGKDLLILAIGLLVAYPATVALQALLLHQTLMGNFPMIVRWMAHRYLLGQSVSFFMDEFAGRVATRVMQTALATREVVLTLLDILVYVGVYFLSVLVLLSSVDWRLALPLLLWLIIYTVILYFVLPRLQYTSERQADARAMMTGRVADSYTNINTVKLFSHAKRESRYARESMRSFLNTVHPQMRLVTVMETAVAANNALMLFLVGATSFYLWTHGATTPGAVAAALALCLRMNGLSEWIMWEVSSLFESIGTVQDGVSTLGKPIGVRDKTNAKELQVRKGDLHFDRIRFSYHPEKPIFEALDLHIQAGEKVGLIGRSGAGKSTLVNLLLRFHDLDSGQIRVDGQDIDAVTQDSLRASIGMVTQDTSLLHRSVRENLLYGRQDASEEELLQALRQARAEEFINMLEDQNGASGLDAKVGERGVKLSGGQRQRIAIARVMLKDAPILILDEATSALDSEVEVAIQESLYDLMEGKTVVAIAHRLSTIAALDRLVVLEQGRIVEQGSHSELLAHNGIYKRLWDFQSGGFLASD
ncbi:MAG: ABC transporter ATP-binding protein [Pseudomonadota bacterium]